MTTETMREAVARAVEEALRAIDSDARLSELTDDEVRAITDAAIRTMLERLREPTIAMTVAGGEQFNAPSGHLVAEEIWKTMFDAAVREVG